MKTFIALALLASNSAFATSPFVGPFVTREIGERGQAGYQACQITSGSVTLIDASGASSVQNISLDFASLQAAVKASSTGKQTRALHMMATVPAVTIIAGDVSNGVNNFQVSRDSSDFVYRTGKGSDYLVGLVSKYCPSRF